MNRIYQGRVSKVEIPSLLSAANGFLRSREREKVAQPDEGRLGKTSQRERNQGEVSNPNPWQPLPNWPDILSVAPKRSEGGWQHHQLFQDAVTPLLRIGWGEGGRRSDEVNTNNTEML
jgi:hypothetical protein